MLLLPGSVWPSTHRDPDVSSLVLGLKVYVSPLPNLYASLCGWLCPMIFRQTWFVLEPSQLLPHLTLGNQQIPKINHLFYKIFLFRFIRSLYPTVTKNNNKKPPNTLSYIEIENNTNMISMNNFWYLLSMNSFFTKKICCLDKTTKQKTQIPLHSGK